MTAAIFGLLGVVVGALLQGGTAWWLERRRADWSARKAGRLVARDLARCRFIVQAGADGAVPWSAVGLELREGLARWEAVSDVLAGTMRSDDDWNTIAKAVAALQRIEQRGRFAPENEQITPDDREMLAWVAEVTWEANFVASLIGVTGTTPRWRAKLMFWRRMSEAEREEVARKLVRYSYEAEDQPVPEDLEPEVRPRDPATGDQELP